MAVRDLGLASVTATGCGLSARTGSRHCDRWWHETSDWLPSLRPVVARDLELAPVTATGSGLSARTGPRRYDGRWAERSDWVPSRYGAAKTASSELARRRSSRS